MCIPHIKAEQYLSIFIFKISLVGQFAITMIPGSMEIQLCRERKELDEVRKAIFW